MLCLLSLPCLVSAQTPHEEAGRLGDASSWRSAEFKADWGLAAIGADHAYARGLTGTGLSLGLLDTGVALDHAEFRDRGHLALHLGQADCGNADTLVFRTATPCFSSDGAQPSVTVNQTQNPDEPLQTEYEYNLHGTHVAGTMVASRNGAGMHGVAYDARLVSARYYGDQLSYEGFDEEGVPVNKRLSTPHANTAARITQAYDQMQAKGVRAVNLEVWRPVRASPASANTVAGLQRTYEGMRAFADALVDATIKHGMITVVASGNDFGRIANIYPSLPVFRPEAEANWLAVVNVTDKSVLDDSSSVCAQAKNWCVAAPGTAIYSTTIKGGLTGKTTGDIEGEAPIRVDLKRGQPVLGYDNETGSSMAAPHAIGALGLLLQRYPYLSAVQVRDVLLTTATDLGEPGVDDKYGWGLINFQKGMEGYGQLRVDTDVVMNAHAGGAKRWSGQAWDDWTNSMGGPGRLSKSGAGWLRLSGDNTFAGAAIKQGVLELTGKNTFSADVTVDGGELLLNGTLMDTMLRVNNGVATINGRVRGKQTQVAVAGRLQGSGTLGDTQVAGTVAPAGDAMGVLHVDGNYQQQAGSVYEADIAAPDSSDRIEVSGAAALLGDIHVHAAPGHYVLGKSFTLLTATGGITGQFGGLQADPLRPFLQWKLRYAPTTVSLDVSRGLAFITAAHGHNQAAVAVAADRQREDSTLINALSNLTLAQAPAAFDSLSGELHASTQTALLASGLQLNDVALARARFGADAFTAQSADRAANGTWVQAISGSGDLRQTEDGAAQTRRSASAMLAGIDHQLNEHILVGALAGVGNGDVQVRARSSRSDIAGRYLGAYAGLDWNGWGIRTGLVGSHNRVRSRREVAIDDIRETLRASYTARMLQAFAEVGYGFGSPRWQWEPYLQWEQSHQRAVKIQESGGVTALAGAGQERVNFYTSGVRFNANLSALEGQTWLNFNGGLCYRLASGDLQPSMAMAWQGGEAFNVVGAPLTRSATLLDLGVSARLSTNSLIELGYSGQLAERGEHSDSLFGRLSVSF